MEIIHLKAAIQKAFSNIGKHNSSAPPESTKNTFLAAYELFCASALRSMAHTRYEHAKQAALDAGIIDEDKAIEGAEIATWKDKLFDVTMKKASGSTTLDRTMLSNELSKQGWSEDKIKALLTSASKPRKGAVTIGFTLKG